MQFNQGNAKRLISPGIDSKESGIDSVSQRSLAGLNDD
jgi:hypothetical protein